MALIMLTNGADGSPLYIQTELVETVTHNNVNNSGNTIVTMASGTAHYVKESPGAVVDHIRHD